MIEFKELKNSVILYGKKDIRCSINKREGVGEPYFVHYDKRSYIGEDGEWHVYPIAYEKTGNTDKLYVMCPYCGKIHNHNCDLNYTGKQYSYCDVHVRNDGYVIEHFPIEYAKVAMKYILKRKKKFDKLCAKMKKKEERQNANKSN